MIALKVGRVPRFLGVHFQIRVEVEDPFQPASRAPHPQYRLQHQLKTLVSPNEDFFLPFSFQQLYCRSVLVAAEAAS